MQKLGTLREYLEYNPNSGEFHWIKSPKNGINIGSLAGTKTGRYKTIHFKGYQYYTHKLAWYFSFGIYPTEVVDHINQNTFDNRIINLRIASTTQNAANKPKRRDNSSGITGVSFDTWSQKYVVRIKNQNTGKYENRGRFNTISEAEQAHNRALNDLGYHPNHGKQLSMHEYRKK